MTGSRFMSLAAWECLSLVVFIVINVLFRLWVLAFGSFRFFLVPPSYFFCNFVVCHVFCLCCPLCVFTGSFSR